MTAPALTDDPILDAIVRREDGNDRMISALSSFTEDEQAVLARAFAAGGHPATMAESAVRARAMATTLVELAEHALADTRAVISSG